MIGQTISHYKILERLGEGGMGAVYKAEDVRLRRTVALKFLPERFALTEEDRERFLREAQAAAALDHPNICTIYEIDEAGGRPFLAMAYVEGRSLDRRIADGPLDLKDAIDIARQAADGLRAAHAKGIVHRDIKSSNLMLADEGSGRPQVKLLDFGLAQLSGRSKLTRADSIMGTVAYMSPEQTQGDKVDARTDIWSLGVVLYEMVAGELPFKGHYDQAMLYAILNEEPQPLTALRSRLPVELDWIIDKCLAKNPDERYQSVGDLLLDLATLEKKLGSRRLTTHQTRVGTGAAPPSAVPAIPPPTGELRKWKRIAVGAAALAGVLAVIVAAAWFGGEEIIAPAQTRRFDINLPPTLPVGAELRSLAISPDGRRIAFAVSGEGRKLWLRDLGQPAAYALDGTDGASDVFWSPDSRTVGYRAGSQLRRVPAEGGPSSVLCEIPGQYFGGASFSADGERVVFTAGPPVQVLEVFARGGQPSALEAHNGEDRRGFPSRPTLIGNGALLYASRSPQGERVSVLRFGGQAPTTLADGSAPFLAPSGHIVYQVGRAASEIWAVPFSQEKLETRGEPFPVAENGMLPSVSNDGTLVYMADPRSGPVRLTFRSRGGEVEGDGGREQLSIQEPAVSADGRWVAWVGDEANASDIWILDRSRNTRTRLTNTPDALEISPHWSPDGRRLTYALLDGENPPRLVIQNAEQPSEVQDVEAGGAPLFPLDWGPRGRILARSRGPGRGEMLELEPQADGTFKPQPALEGEMGVNEAEISPDGRFVAFESRVGEESQIVVRPFPAGAGRWQVTSEGGESPHWTREGREILYRSGGRLLSVAVEEKGGELLFGDPKELFQDPMLLGGPRRPGYAVTPDGQTIILAEAVGRPSPPTIRVVLNWLAEYRR
jgi:serine/threonine-protein kinase